MGFLLVLEMIVSDIYNVSSRAQIDYLRIKKLANENLMERCKALRLEKYLITHSKDCQQVQDIIAYYNIAQAK